MFDHFPFALQKTRKGSDFFLYLQIKLDIFAEMTVLAVVCQTATS
jgi:hypothetical protein